MLVLGGTERGKSSYCHFLVQQLCGASARVAFVDADIGQKDVGPPATVSLGFALTSPARRSWNFLSMSSCSNAGRSSVNEEHDFITDGWMPWAVRG